VVAFSSEVQEGEVLILNGTYGITLDNSFTSLAVGFHLVPERK
jgi:hypothetical protein